MNEVEIKFNLTESQLEDAEITLEDMLVVPEHSDGFVGQTEDKRIIDTYYDSDSEKKTSLRVRETYFGDGGGFAEITWKGPKEVSEIGERNREEISVVTQDLQEALLLLEKLGYKKANIISKTRRSKSVYVNGKLVTIDIDKIDGGGQSIEFETDSQDNLEALQEAIVWFGLDTANAIRGYGA